MQLRGSSTFDGCLLLLSVFANCATVASSNCLDNHSNLQENNQKQIPRTQIDETHFISIKVARRLRTEDRIAQRMSSG